MIEIAITATFWLVPILLGYIFGRAAEARHFRSIIAREQTAVHLPTTSSKAPIGDDVIQRSELVHGSVVISIGLLQARARGLAQYYRRPGQIARKPARPRAA